MRQGHEGVQDTAITILFICIHNRLKKPVANTVKKARKNVTKNFNLFLRTNE